MKHKIIVLSLLILFIFQLVAVCGQNATEVYKI